MKVEFRLQSLLREYSLHKFGIEAKLARHCHVNRHTIGKIFRNEFKNPSLTVIGKICGYLVQNGVPAEILPGALFSCRPAGLWRAIGRSKRIAIYLGMYVHLKPNRRPGPAHETIASDDAAASDKISHLLSSKAEMGDSRPLVETRYVPFTFHPAPEQVAGERFEKDKQHAEKIHGEILERRPDESAILLGSQRANYLVEYLVADLFGCQAFQPVNGHPKVPFFLSYRDFDRPVPSCFGGRSNPPGVNGAVKSGIWFLDDNHEWQLNPWGRNEQGSGIVITRRDTDSILVALFGFSGRSTYAICKHLIEHPEEFWDSSSDDEPELPLRDKRPNEKESTSEKSGKKPGRPKARNRDVGHTVVRDAEEIGVYICRIEFSRSEKNENPWLEKVHETDKVAVQPLAKPVLRHFLRRR